MMNMCFYTHSYFFFSLVLPENPEMFAFYLSLWYCTLFVTVNILYHQLVVVHFFFGISSSFRIQSKFERFTRIDMVVNHSAIINIPSHWIWHLCSASIKTQCYIVGDISVQILCNCRTTLLEFCVKCNLTKELVAKSIASSADYLRWLSPNTYIHINNYDSIQHPE